MRGLTLAPLILAAALVADANAEPVYESARVPADSAPSLLEADDDVWSRARTIAWGPKKYETTFRALWNDSGLFVRFDAHRYIYEPFDVIDTVDDAVVPDPNAPKIH